MCRTGYPSGVPNVLCHVRRQPPRGAGGQATPLKSIPVALAPGVPETSDVALAAAKTAAASFGGVTPGQVICNHRAEGGFVAYLPAEKA
jgi:hypothetical protein